MLKVSPPSSYRQQRRLKELKEAKPKEKLINYQNRRGFTESVVMRWKILLKTEKLCVSTQPT